VASSLRLLVVAFFLACAPPYWRLRPFLTSLLRRGVAMSLLPSLSPEPLASLRLLRR